MTSSFKVQGNPDGLCFLIEIVRKENVSERLLKGDFIAATMDEDGNYRLVIATDPRKEALEGAIKAYDENVKKMDAGVAAPIPVRN